MQKILWVFILFGFVVSCADKEAEKEIAQKQSQLEKVNLQVQKTKATLDSLKAVDAAMQKTLDSLDMTP